MVVDAMFRGMQTPGHYKLNFKQVEETEKSAHFLPMQKEKPREKEIVGPGSYDI